MSLSNVAKNHFDRRRGGRFLPRELANYSLKINNKPVAIDKLTDIGPEGFKIIHRAFNEFSVNSDHNIELRQNGRVLFATTAKACWRRDFRFPLNTVLIGFQFNDENLRIAKFWADQGYQPKGFKELNQGSNYSRFRKFHQIVFGNLLVKKYFGFMPLRLLPHIGVPLLLAWLYVAFFANFR